MCVYDKVYIYAFGRCLFCSHEKREKGERERKSSMHDSPRSIRRQLTETHIHIAYSALSLPPFFPASLLIHL